MYSRAKLKRLLYSMGSEKELSVNMVQRQCQRHRLMPFADTGQVPHSKLIMQYGHQTSTCVLRIVIRPRNFPVMMCMSLR